MTKEERPITFDARKVTTIHFDEPKAFKNSISFEAYVKAFEMTKEIVDSQKTSGNDDYRNPGEGTNRRNQEQVYNIISFTGARGSGKTSVMLSYMEFLKDYCRNISKNSRADWEPKEMYDEEFRVMFTGLEYIDASLMNEEEEILGSVLAKMFSKWQLEEGNSAEGRGIAREEDYNYRKRQLNKEFGNVYEYLRILKNPDKVLSEDSEIVFDELPKLSMSRNLKKSFQDLVCSYLKIMRYPGKNYHYDKHFLVICIDDLDMNIQNGYRLLEEIRKYLMIPNVLVLLTVNMDQLEKISMEHYFQEFENIGKKEDDYITALTTEYLDKIMPGHRQILLPSEQDWPFFKDRKLKIINREGDFFKKALSVKDFSRKYFEHFLNMKFDADSVCLTYLTPGTIREFGEWIESVSSFSRIEDQKEREEKCRQWFWKDCLYKLCKKKLHREDVELLQNASKEKLEKQLIWLGQKIQPERSQAVYFPPFNDKQNMNVKVRCMGEFLELLSEYESARLWNRDIANIMKIFFTEAIAEQADSDQKGAIKKYYLDFYGYSVWGNWENKMLNSYVELFDGNASQIVTGRSEYAGEQAEFGVELSVKENFDLTKWDDIVEMLTEAKNYKKIVDFQYILLFHSELKNSRGEIWEVSQKNSEEEKKVILKLNSDSSGVFGISSFVMNCYEGASIVAAFIDDVLAILKSGSDFDSHNSGESIEQLVCFLSILKKTNKRNSFYKNYGYEKKILSQIEQEPLLPLENIEFLFRTGEKLAHQLGGEDHIVRVAVDKPGDREIKEGIIRGIRQFFDTLEKSLQELAKVYEEKKYILNWKENSLVKQIQGKDDGLINLLAENVMKVGRKSSNIISGEAEWGGDN